MARGIQGDGESRGHLPWTLAPRLVRFVELFSNSRYQRFLESATTYGSLGPVEPVAGVAEAGDGARIGAPKEQVW